MPRDSRHSRRILCARSCRLAAVFASRTRATARLCVVFCAWFALPAPGCHKPAPSTSEEGSSTPSGRTVESTPTPAREEIPLRVDIGPAAGGSDSWLAVEKVRGDSAGAWATGEFDQKRNKLTIVTHAVERFTIDVGRIPIRWDRLVILGIDGNNSELARREFDVLHFVNDKHGWHVVKP